MTDYKGANITGAYPVIATDNANLAKAVVGNEFIYMAFKTGFLPVFAPGSFSAAKTADYTKTVFSAFVADAATPVYQMDKTNTNLFFVDKDFVIITSDINLNIANAANALPVT